MKRSPLTLKPTPEQLRTGSTLARSTAPIARQAINAVSPKRYGHVKKSQEYRLYRDWSKRMRAEVGRCELESKVCEKRPDGIHHVIKLSQGGARIPGPLAEAQGQIFKVSCNPCNWYVEADRQWAVEHGFVKSNPLRGQKFDA